VELMMSPRDTSMASASTTVTASDADAASSSPSMVTMCAMAERTPVRGIRTSMPLRSKPDATVPA
jgi:hypothetical protein